MSDFVPGELLIDILKRLSAEDLVRCLRVCKSWYSLIANPSFISLHSQIQYSSTNNENNNRLLLVRSWDNRYGEESYSIRFDNDSFQEYKSLNLPFKSLNSRFRVIGCFNGVLCLIDDLPSSKYTITLWNPSIRKSVTLPDPVGYDKLGDSIGFAFCEATNNFKVVRVFHLNKVSPRIEVYDLSKGYWRGVDPKGFPHFVHPSKSQAYLNGAVHWTGGSSMYMMMDDQHFNTIVSFDMGREELGVIPMPDRVALDLSWPQTIRVSVLEESLSLIVNQITDSIWDIWVMKEYGKPETWSKLFNVGLTFWRNGHVLVKEHPDTSMGCKPVSYDPESRQVKRLGINGSVESFVETLALLGCQGESLQTQCKCRSQRRLVTGTGKNTTNLSLFVKYNRANGLMELEVEPDIARLGLTI